MLPVVLLLLGAMAVLHALWNVLLKRAEDPLATAARGVAWGLLIATPPLAAIWVTSGVPLPSGEALVFAAGSALVELLYFVFLSAAYRRGDLSTVYPIARGTAPVLSVVSGLALLNERLQPVALAGVALVLAGIWLVRVPSGSGPAVRYALMAGVTIATYSTLDRLGVLAAQPWLYAWVLWLFTAALLRAAILVRPGLVPAARWSSPTATAPGPAAASGPEGRGRDVVVGVAMLGGWLFVLFALSLAPLAAVAPLREAGIVLTAGWGVLRLGETRRAGLRLAGAAAIALGVVLVAVA